MKSLKAELENVQITVDLVQDALHHLDFLAEIDSVKDNLIKLKFEIWPPNMATTTLLETIGPI